MDCFCLRKKNVYDFSSPYTMASSGTYRTSVIDDSSPSKNGHVQTLEKNGKHRESISSEESHDEITLNKKNTKNAIHDDLEKDTESLKDLERDTESHKNIDKDTESHKDINEDKDHSPDVNRNHHESQQNPTIVIEEVSEVSQVNTTLTNDQGQNRVSQVSVSSSNGQDSNEFNFDHERNSVTEEGNDDDDDESQSDIVQGYSVSQDSDELNHSSSKKDQVTYEEEQNVRNSSYSGDQSVQSEALKVDLVTENNVDHTPSYDVTAAAKDVPHDVVHMY